MKLGFGYAFSPKAELIGSFTYARAAAEELSVGNAISPTSTASPSLDSSD